MTRPLGCPASLSPTRLHVEGEGGIGINVWDHGGDGPTLLLTHCTGTLARIWDPVVRLLAGRFHCVAVDTRGQGDSEAPRHREEYAWPLSGRDVLHVIDQLSLEGTLVGAGHSAGGTYLTHAERLRPGLFSRLTLVDAIMGPDAIYQANHNPLPDLSRRRVNAFPSLDAARQRFRAKPPMNSWVEEAVELYLEHALREREDGQWELKCPGDREAWFYELGGGSDVFEELEQVLVPTRILTGEHSDTRILAEMQYDRIPHARLHVIEGAGHFLVQEKPEEVARELLWMCAG